MQYRRNRLRLGAAADPNCHAINLNLNYPGEVRLPPLAYRMARCACRRWRFHDRGHKQRRCRVTTRSLGLPRLPAPTE